jgi:predicted RND superfamily exporter protein
MEDDQAQMAKTISSQADDLAQKTKTIDEMTETIEDKEKIITELKELTKTQAIQNKDQEATIQELKKQNAFISEQRTALEIEHKELQDTSAKEI